MTGGHDRESIASSLPTVLFLTNNDNAVVLYEWILKRTTVALKRDKLQLADLERLRPDLVVSYNYQYLIDGECIKYMNGNMVNLHISLLPWNRGSSPNIWSFIDDTPKGITIHLISEELDKGAILYQQEFSFDPSDETFESTYRKLNDGIIELFQKHWNEFCDGSYKNGLHPQEGQGSYHNKADLKQLSDEIDFSWSDNIALFIERYKMMQTAKSESA